MQGCLVLLTEQRTEQLISVLWLQIHKHLNVGLLQEQAVASREQELYIYFFFAQTYFHMICCCVGQTVLSLVRKLYQDS